MRRSEWAAVVAVAALTVPGILAILALPAWLVVRAWPTMDALDRTSFAAGLSSLALSARPVIGPRLRSLFFGRMEDFTAFELVLLVAPLVVSWVAVSHDWFLPALVGGSIVLFKVQVAIEERARPRPAVPLRQKPPDRIEPRLTFASVVGSHVPRRWRDRWRRIVRRWRAAHPLVGRCKTPPGPPNGDP